MINHLSHVIINDLSSLCSGVKVEEVIEMRARSVDIVNHCYYDLLYCYNISRNNLRKGVNCNTEFLVFSV